MDDITSVAKSVSDIRVAIEALAVIVQEGQRREIQAISQLAEAVKALADNNQQIINILKGDCENLPLG